MRIKFLILSLFVVMLVASLGCIGSKKLPAPNETKIAISEPTVSIPEQKTPAYNDTKNLKITFETWSKGYWSNTSYEHPYFRVITNYSDWNAFLDEQGYFTWLREGGPMRLEGQLFPGLNKMPKTITPADFDENIIIAAMMGMKGFAEGPEIEIKNISRFNNILNITVRMYDPRGGAAVVSAPYHIVIVKRDLVPENSRFYFRDTEGKLLARIARGNYRSFPPLIETISVEHPILKNDTGIKEVIEDYYFGDFRQECSYICEGGELKFVINGYPKRYGGEEIIIITLQNAFTEKERLKNIEITPERGEPVAFRAVAVGNSSGYTSLAFMIINNSTEWIDVWQKHSSYLKTQKPQIPEIDFTNETVVAVFFGESPAYDAGLIDITREGRTVFINIQKRYPASHYSVQPYFIIRMSKTTDNVILRTLKYIYT